MKRFLLILVFLFPTAAVADAPRFVEETPTAGIESVYQGDFEYMPGAGLAVFDCSGDGLPELYFAGGTAVAKLYRNRSTPGVGLKFSEETGSSLALTQVIGAYPLDVDGDRVTDLAVLRVGENLLFRGLGDCRFEPANQDWGLAGGKAWTTAFSATWEKGRDWPTLAFGNFINLEKTFQNFGECDTSMIHRPKAGGGYGAPMPLVPGHCTLSILFSDWNRDGVPDLRLSNDKEFYKGGEEQLFRLPPGTAPVAYGRADGWRKVNIWGMGIASHDVTGDGYPEYYLTNMAENRFEVLESAARPAFRDRATAMGIAAGYPFTGGDKKPSTAWHAEFGDVNNDGLADLLVVKGNVKLVKANADVDPNNLLIQKPDGSFVETAAASGVLSYELGRSGALVDLNRDGRLELVVTNRHSRARIWRNVTPPEGRNWLSVQLVQPGGNWSAIGAWIEVRTGDKVQRRECLVGGGHAGGQWGPMHFGLGAATTAELRVQWPGGSWGRWKLVSAGRVHRIAK
jgi:hypothetical protein